MIAKHFAFTVWTGRRDPALLRERRHNFCDIRNIEPFFKRIIGKTKFFSNSVKYEYCFQIVSSNNFETEMIGVISCFYINDV